MRASLDLPSVLEPLRGVLESLLAPCILLAPGGAGSTLTRTGGLPLLQPGSRWPEGPDGPLAFIGQIDFGEMAAAGGAGPGLPDAGLLALFYDRDNYWGAANDEEPGARARLIHTRDAGGAVELAAPEGLALEPEIPLLPLPGVSLPDLDDRALCEEPRFGDSAIVDAYIAFLIAFVDAQRPPTAGDDHRLGGHPTWLGEDGRDVAARRAGTGGWQALWQIETTGFEGWDDGMLHVLIRDEDLAARNFAAAQVLLQLA